MYFQYDNLKLPPCVLSMLSEVILGAACSKLAGDVQRQLAETGAAGAAAAALHNKARTLVMNIISHFI